MGEVSLREIEFTRIDPLARAYSRLTQFLDAPSGGPVDFGAIEYLDRLDLGAFEFITVGHDLGRVRDLPRGLEQMIKRLAPRGLIRLEQRGDQAERREFDGWKITLEDGCLCMSRKDRREVFDHQAAGFRLRATRDFIASQPAPQQETLCLDLVRGW